jgi:hypothetical protein
MRWFAILVVLASLRADARPRRIDRADDYRPPPVCRGEARWKKFAACQLRNATFEVIRDLPKAKLVAVELPAHSRGGKRLELYVLGTRGWLKGSSFYAETTTSELLAFHELANDTFRLDVGSAHHTWVSLDQTSSRPAVLKRQVTFLCSSDGVCRSVVTGCEVIVHGKAVALFRGVPQWEGASLTIRGDARSTNRYCPKPPALIDTSES